MQRMALLIDGARIHELKTRRLELDYDLMIKKVAREDKPFLGNIPRTAVITKVYLESPSDPTAKWTNFTEYLRGLGYDVQMCDTDGIEFAILHDILVYTLMSRVDAITLITGEVRYLNGEFARGIYTARLHGVHTEVMGIGTPPAHLEEQGVRFYDLESTIFLHPDGYRN